MVPTIEFILLLIVIFLITALPLHLAVLFMGGKSTLIKAFLVTFISGILFSSIASYFMFGAILAFFILIWIYRELFRLKWWKAFVVWFLQFIFLFILMILFAVVFGLSLSLFQFGIVSF